MAAFSAALARPRAEAMACAPRGNDVDARAGGTIVGFFPERQRRLDLRRPPVG